MKIKDSFGDRVFNCIIYVVLAVLVLIVIYPLWLVVINSFSNSNAGQSLSSYMALKRFQKSARFLIFFLFLL